MKNEIYIVDDHKMLLKGLKDYLEENTDFRVPYVFTTKAECLKKLTTTKANKLALPEIIIIDVQLTDGTGFSLVQEITEKFKDIKCVMYSMYDTAGYILQARNSGARGYISKVASENELVRCLKTIQDGGYYIEEKMKDSQEKLSQVTPMFTKQESRILEKLLQGKSNEEISSELFISSHTVENYVSFIYDKTGVRNRSELIAKFK